MRRLIAGCGVALAFAAACGGKSSSPNAPTNTTTTVPLSTFTLSGTVTSTSGTAIAGATARIVDGLNATRSATTNSAGFYSISSQTITHVARLYPRHDSQRDSYQRDDDVRQSAHPGQPPIARRLLLLVGSVLLWLLCLSRALRLLRLGLDRPATRWACASVGFLSVGLLLLLLTGWRGSWGWWL